MAGGGLLRISRTMIHSHTSDSFETLPARSYVGWLVFGAVFCLSQGAAAGDETTAPIAESEPVASESLPSYNQQIVRSKQATKLFFQGRQAVKQGDLARACDLFVQSNELDEKVGTLLNLAACREKRGQLLEALDTWRASERLAERLNDERIGVARDREAALERRIPTVELSVVLQGASCSSLLVDGKQQALVGRTPRVTLRLNPGRHTGKLSCKGRRARVWEFSLAAEEHKHLVVEPGPSLSVAVGPVHRDTARSEHLREGDGQGQRTWALVLGGVGLVGVTAAVASGVMLLDRRQIVDEHCDLDHNCDDVGAAAAKDGQWLTVANAVAWGVGTVSLGAGAYLYVTSGPLRNPSGGSSSSQTEVPLLNDARLNLRVTF